MISLCVRQNLFRNPHFSLELNLVFYKKDFSSNCSSKTPTETSSANRGLSFVAPSKVAWTLSSMVVIVSSGASTGATSSSVLLFSVRRRRHRKNRIKMTRMMINISRPKMMPVRTPAGIPPFESSSVGLDGSSVKGSIVWTGPEMLPYGT